MMSRIRRRPKVAVQLPVRPCQRPHVVLGIAKRRAGPIDRPVGEAKLGVPGSHGALGGHESGFRGVHPVTVVQGHERADRLPDPDQADRAEHLGDRCALVFAQGRASHELVGDGEPKPFDREARRAAERVEGVVAGVEHRGELLVIGDGH
jgi:hypothetical protein